MMMSVVLISLYLMYFMSIEVQVVGLSVLCFLCYSYLINTEMIVSLASSVMSDMTSSSLVVLSIFLTLMAVLSSMSVVRPKSFGAAAMSVLLFLVLSFGSSSLFFFFFFFESVLIPLIILILSWGYQPERLQACSYMVVYTLSGSLMFLLGLSSFVKSGMSDLTFFYGNMVMKAPCYLWWVFYMGFMIKLPMYPFHLWLPKAHVEAPVSGSMLLAGVVLKLGGYGIIRFIKFAVVKYSMWSFWSVLFINLLGGVYAGLVCFRQVDLKCLVAYSSVSHMSLVMLGLMSNTFIGITGGLLIMVGHGLCSSGMFSMVNIFYKSSLSRLLLLNKGYLILSPFISLMVFLLSSSNMAAPPSLNLLGEIFIFIISSGVSFIFLILVMLLSFISACYSLFIYYSCNHGKSSAYLRSQTHSSFLDMLVLQFHWIPLNYLFMFTFCVFE